MEYYARFERIDRISFRFDTRIYLETFTPKDPGKCVGAIVGKNPGSATPHVLGRLAPLALNGDKMLPTVGNRFVKAFRNAGKPIPENGFVRVWNLLYVCNKDLKSALKVAARLTYPPVDPTEDEFIPLLWFGWGGRTNGLDQYKTRFLEKKLKKCFFYDHHASRIVHRAPCIDDFAKHTQGMPEEPLVKKLAMIL